MNKKQWVAVIVVAIIAIIGWALPVSRQAAQQTFGTIYDTFTGDYFNAYRGFQINGTAVLDSSQNLTLTGTAKFDGAVLHSYTNATTSGTAVTLKQSDFDGYSTILPYLTGGNTTWTFPASSTLSTFLPTAGDWQETCINNDKSSYTLTLAAGTGIDIKTASSTPSDLTILAGGSACIKFLRNSATTTSFDIGVLITEYSNGD